MICRKCKVKFHYCTSCGYEFCLDNGFCSDSCAQTFYQDRLTDLVCPATIDEEIAELVIKCEDSTPYYFRDYIRAKQSIHTMITEKLLTDDRRYVFD